MEKVYNRTDLFLRSKVNLPDCDPTNPSVQIYNTELTPFFFFPPAGPILSWDIIHIAVFPHRNWLPLWSVVKEHLLASKSNSDIISPPRFYDEKRLRTINGNICWSFARTIPKSRVWINVHPSTSPDITFHLVNCSLFANTLHSIFNRIAFHAFMCHEVNNLTPDSVRLVVAYGHLLFLRIVSCT